MRAKKIQLIIFTVLGIICGVAGGLFIDFAFYGTGAFLALMGFIFLICVAFEWFD